MADRTSFAAIRRIPGGKSVRFGLDGRVRAARFWDPWTLPVTDESLSLASCATLLRAGIDTAITRAIGSSEAVGAHVSGGLDSTAVACRAHQHLREAGRGGLIAGYSWSPDDTVVARLPDDERDRIDDAARTAGFPVRYRGLDDSDGGFSSLDPDRYPWTIITDETTVMATAAADGVRVMLNGFGGDEAASFKGNQVRAQWARRGQFDRLARQSWQNAALTGAPPTRRVAAVLRDVGGGLLDLLPASARHATRPVRYRRGRRHDAYADAVLRANFPAAADARRERLERNQAARTPRDVMITKLTAGYLQERINSWYQLGQRHRIDYRYPLLDLDLVTAAVAMPAHAFAFRGWNRPAYRLATADWTPPSITWQPHKNDPAHTASRATTTPPHRRQRNPEIETLIADTWAAIAPRRAHPRRNPRHH